MLRSGLNKGTLLATSKRRRRRATGTLPCSMQLQMHCELFLLNLLKMNQALVITIQILTAILVACTFSLGCFIVIRYYKELCCNKPTFWFYITSLLCILSCIITAWAIKGMENIIVFTICEIMQTCWFYCLLISYRLLNIYLKMQM